MRDLEREFGAGDAGFTCVQGKILYFVSVLFFFKKSFDAVDKILNILDVERGGLGGRRERDGTGDVPYDDIVNLVL